MPSALSPSEIFDQMIAKDHFSRWMGIELIELKMGYCKLKMSIRPDMLNGFGILHGGVSFSFADSAFAFASNSHGRLSVSQTSQITHVKAAQTGDVLIAEAKELQLGNKMATYDVKVYREEDTELIALFRGSVYRTSRSFDEEESPINKQ